MLVIVLSSGQCQVVMWKIECEKLTASACVASFTLVSKFHCAATFNVHSSALFLSISFKSCFSFSVSIRILL